MKTREAGRHRPRKRFAQHFLAAPWAQKVVDAIRPAPGDVFLEIGPGTGALTLPLARTGAPILAIELDRDLVASLSRSVPPNVTLISGDFLDVDAVPFLYGLGAQTTLDSANRAAVSRRVRVVGNLPYNLTSPILYRLAELQRQHKVFFDATLMVQREVADRLVAKPRSRDYGVLTVTLQLVAATTRLLNLPPGAFRPAPKVWSSVVRLVFGEPSVRIADPLLLERVIKAAFGQRRKTLSNALKGVVPQPAQVLERAGLNPTRRAETLTLEDFARLADECGRANRLPVL